MNKKMIVRVILVVWVIIWGLFLIRPYFKKSILAGYARLFKLSTEDKRAYVTGEELYAFMKFCKDSVKEPSTYKMVGIEDYSIEHRRLRYYFYPYIEKENPEYLFVYKTKNFHRDGYKPFSRLDAETYILKRTN